MRAVIITVGSRGDAEPFCSLAAELGANGHHVDIFLQKELKHLSPSSASVHELPFTQMDFYKFVGSPTHGVDHENPRVKFVGVVTDVIAELTFPCCEQVLDVAKASDMIITSSLARPLSMALATKLNIPACVVHLQALVPTDKFPHFSQTEECVSVLTKGNKEANASFEETYWKLEGFHHEFLQDRLDAVYTKLELPPLRFDSECKKALTGQDEGKTLIANAFSMEIVPSVHDKTATIYDVGPLADAYVPDTWNPPADLITFLDSCEVPPVCIGYGSMPFGKAEMVLEALEELDRKAVLVGDALKVADGNEWVKSNIFQVSSAPYAWLLPQCSMMLSHGGAGVVNSTLRAGIPCVISPLMGDQFFWAKLLEAMELGVQAGANLGGLTKEDVVCGIKRADACKAGAKALREKIALKETGVRQLVDVLEDRIS
jgi:sterol 3beta-glucosyltransferase